MMQWDDYAQVLAACNAAHIALVESEATFATVQVRLREATMEGADDQVAYLEGRVTVLAPLVDRGTRAVAALVVEAEHRRDRALVTNVEAALAALTALVSMMERSLTLTPPPAEALATAATLVERVEREAGTLPQGEYPLRVTASELVMRVRAIQQFLPNPLTPGPASPQDQAIILTRRTAPRRFKGGR